MENNTNILTDTQLIERLNRLAKEKNTSIDTIIKLVMAENNQLRNNPDNYITETKVSRSKNGKSKSYTYSTVIPKPILNKFRLEKGQVLYWDIDDNKLIITPEVKPVPTPEEASIQAGTEIFNDMLFNGKASIYTTPLNSIIEVLSDNKPDVKTNEDKVTFLVNQYKNVYSDKRNGIVKDNQRGFKQVVLYLLDYPLNLPNQYDILKEVYEEITKNWLAPVLNLELLTI